jgi:hypothetical protein
MNADRSNTPPRRAPKRWLRFSLGGLLFFVFCWTGLWAGVRFGAQRIALNPDPLQLVVAQRSTQAIPGLQDLAHIQLQDITQGQVILSVHDRAKRPLVGPVSASNGDVLSFKVKGQTFHLYVRYLENQLIGDDRARLEISTTDHWSGATLPQSLRPKQSAGSSQSP